MWALVALTALCVLAAIALQFTQPKRNYRSRTVSEMVASEIADGLKAVADEFLTLAGVGAYLAASRHSDTAGEQRQLAAVIFQTARLKFGGVKYDGRKIEEADIAQLDALWSKMTGGKKLSK